jgi:hypothetical protein
LNLRYLKFLKSHLLPKYHLMLMFLNFPQTHLNPQSLK